MSNLTVAQLSAKDAASKRIDLAPGHTIYIPGSIIQVKHTVIYTPTAISVPAGAGARTNIPDLAVSITPRSLNSKILVKVRWFGEFSPQTASWNTMMGLKRNGAPVGVNPSATAIAALGIAMPALSYYLSDAGSTPEMCNFDFMDTPNSLEAVLYQVYADSTEASTLYNQRAVSATAGCEYGSSTITAWEIAG